MKKEKYFILLCLLALLVICSGCSTGSEGNENTDYNPKGGITGTGWQELDGNTYYCLDDGSMATGWLELDGARFYLRQSGSLVTGWLSLDGQRYYLTDSGALTGICSVDGSTYVFDKNGCLTSGWADLGSQTAYGDRNCHPITGWQEIDDKCYYFNSTGILQTGLAEIDGFTYGFREDGSPMQGITEIGQFASNGQLIPLVNPWYYVPEGYTVELKQINKDHRIAAVALRDLKEMLADCTLAGHQPVVCSSYRTQEYQEGLFQRKVERLLEDKKNTYTEEEARIVAAQSVAIPGTSEHQLGLAADIIDDRNWNLDESQAQMPTQQWLMEHSWRYGWILRYPNEKSEITGIIYEPWHYRYVGREIAAEIHELGVCLEEYLQMLTAGIG